MATQRFAQLGVTGVLGLALTALGIPGTPTLTLPPVVAQPVTAVVTQVAPLLPRLRVCGTPVSGGVACGALVVTKNGRPSATKGPKGFGAAALEKAYGLLNYPTSNATIAVVDAFSDPTALADLNTYRKANGLSAMSASCSKHPCFTQTTATGATTGLPRKDASWDQEISLDLDLAAAGCPTCNITLVDAPSGTPGDLAAAVGYAKTIPGVLSVSNSYGGDEDPAEDIYKDDYTPARAGQWIVASAGDNGYGAQFPAAFASVVSVGGTSLTLNSKGGYGSETAWNGGGSGCSAYEPATFNTTVCGGQRAIADVSADADPDTGVAVYDGQTFQGVKGWLRFGGTSAAAPFIAGIHAMARSGSSSAATLYQPGAALRDVTSGSNGSCSPSILCKAGRGWDGPTGLGSPNGTTNLAGF